MYDTETENAIQRSDKHANGEWKKDAYYALRRLAEEKEEFTADDFWAFFKARFSTATHEPRALGAIFRLAIENKIISKTGRYYLSKRRHATPISVWRSNVFAPASGAQTEMFANCSGC